MITSLLLKAIKASIVAGEKIMYIYDNEDFEVDFKSDDSPLTKADLASHNEIVAILENTDIPVLSEEGKNIPYADRKGWEQLWIVDPIDGTKEFIKKNGEFTVNIALIENQKAVLGVIYVPVLKELYFSSVEHGAFKCYDVTAFDKESLEDWIAASDKLPVDKGRTKFTVVASRSHLSPETEAFIEDLKKEHGEIDTISKGSSLKLCMVAEGEADCYPRFAPTMEWDTAAGQAICEHAGFEVIDYKTQKPMLYNREELLNNWFLVKNK
ncbi:3'(2'),5'-bisphosphate nucleotidase CysQ [Neptunitalea lumnitzerae]|uniref:3'(2'),5'-bisphosphate nucleotidase CysQ n=1 Tax=Neptunitalea lumnitzerae TaxID=2965509 RepID=A0ABQ5MGV6_9FLAO|nr:3'(2'),5'-bisphosphate nucleotidase CysQ [Neptunitalea sp. Y10]GLB48649.1 3'(2'),5'-bisphosphate nucleotidase CysQ [Neptunitalea sp. Y10]